MGACIQYGLLLVSLTVWAQSTSAQTEELLNQKATELFQKRELTAAREKFSRLLNDSASAPRARYYLGRIALLESKPMEAIQWLEPIVKSNPPIFDATAQLSKAYLDTGQLEKAKVIAKDAIKNAEWDGALHYRLGRIYQQMGEGENARKEFAESVRLKSEDRESVQLLLECAQHITSRENTEAMRVRGQLLANASLDPDVLVALGLLFTGAGLHEQSLEPFATAAKRDPTFFQAQYNAGLALLKVGRAADAVEPLQASLRLVPESTDTLSALSIAYVFLGRYADALPVLETWHRFQPDHPRASTMLALAYLRTASPTKSVALLRGVVRNSRIDPKPYYLLIEALNATERQGEALTVADEAARIFPDAAQPHLAKAQQLARLGRYADAGPEFTHALELAPDNMDSLLGLAEVRQKQGDYAGALAIYRRALAADAGNVTAALGVARNLFHMQKPAEARGVLETAVKAHGENSQLHYELSRVYARLGERELATEETRVVQELRARETKTQ